MTMQTLVQSTVIKLQVVLCKVTNMVRVQTSELKNNRSMSLVFMSVKCCLAAR